METNILIEIERLKHDYQDLKLEIKELNNIINKSQISNSRKRGVYTSAGTTCEAILKFIYQKDANDQKPANKLMLDELLIKLNHLIPIQVMINFRTIQAWRNLGTHDKDDMRNIDSNSFIMVDMALSNIVNWFFTAYLKIDFSFDTDQPKNLIQNNAIDDNVNPNEQVDSKNKKQLTYTKEKKIVNTKKEIQENKSTKNTYPLKDNDTEIIKYSEFKIGNQIWMLDNLCVTTFKNGDPVPEARSKQEWANADINKEPAWCYFKSDAKGDKSNGLLYNWYAIEDPRGLAPIGWKIPTIQDFRHLMEIVLDQKINLESKSRWKKLYRRKETGTYTNASNPGFWSSSSGSKNGYCFIFQETWLSEDSMPKGTGFPIVCIKS